ncbi:MAG: peptidoglycan-binding protein, partial [Bacteroidota bacterium]
MKKLLFFCLVLFSMLSQNKAQIPSTRVFFSDDDCLQYVSDVLGNFIPDFSYAGYQYGEVPLPELPVVKTIAPVSGDNTEHIQTALDELAQLTPDSNGFRGALLLEAGLYRIEGVLTIGGSGIVLRGVGQAADTLSNTVLLGTGNTPNDRDVVRVGGASGQSDSWTTELSGSKTKVNAFVPAGARTIAVEDISLYEAGDEIIVKHISS